MIKGYFFNPADTSNVFYMVLVDAPNLANPPPFPDETEITDDENTIFFRRQRIYITALRDAIIEFLKDGMEHTFQNRDELINLVRDYLDTATAVDNESVVILRNLFKNKNADFLSFMDIEHGKVGIAIKIPKVDKSNIENCLADTIDYVVQQINQENPAAKRPTLQERINYILQESEKEQEEIGGAGMSGFPFIGVSQQAEERAKNSLFSIRSLLSQEEAPEEVSDEDSVEENEEIIHLEDDTVQPSKKREGIN